MNIIKIVLALVYVYFMFYIYMLEKQGCKCSEDWRRDFIKYYLGFMIFMLLFSAFFVTYAKSKLKISKKVLASIDLVVILLNIVSFIIVFQYIHKLKTESCICSEGAPRTAMEFLNYFNIASVMISIIIIIVFAISRKIK